MNTLAQLFGSLSLTEMNQNTISDSDASAALQQAIEAMEFTSRGDAIQWLICYAAHGACCFSEFDISDRLIAIAQSIGECDHPNRRFTRPDVTSSDLHEQT